MCFVGLKSWDWGKERELSQLKIVQYAEYELAEFSDRSSLAPPLVQQHSSPHTSYATYKPFQVLILRADNSQITQFDEIRVKLLTFSFHFFLKGFGVCS